MIPERAIRTETDVRVILGRISFAPSGVRLREMDLQWEVEPIWLEGVLLDEPGKQAWRIRLTFRRPDRETGEEGRGAGRWEIVEPGSTESTVFKTAWVLLELLVRHELMEAFLVDGVRPFDPHRTIAELCGGGS